MQPQQLAKNSSSISKSNFHNLRYNADFDRFGYHLQTGAYDPAQNRTTPDEVYSDKFSQVAHLCRRAFSLVTLLRTLALSRRMPRRAPPIT